MFSGRKFKFLFKTRRACDSAMKEEIFFSRSCTRTKMFVAFSESNLRELQ